MSDIVMKPYKIFKFFVYSACLGSGTFFFYWTFVTLLLNVSNIVGIIKNVRIFVSTYLQKIVFYVKRVLFIYH